MNVNICYWEVLFLGEEDKGLGYSVHQGQVHAGVNQQKGIGCNWEVLLLEEMGKGQSRVVSQS